MSDPVLEARAVHKSFRQGPVLLPVLQRCGARASPPASGSRSSAPPAPARPRCCRFSAASTARPPARCCVAGRDIHALERAASAACCAIARSASSTSSITCCRSSRRSRTWPCRCWCGARRSPRRARAAQRAARAGGPRRAARRTGRTSSPAASASARRWRARSSPQPRMVLADEPTGNLDGANAAQVFALMLELNRERGTSLVVVTHDLRLATPHGARLRARARHAHASAPGERRRCSVASSVRGGAVAAAHLPAPHAARASASRARRATTAHRPGSRPRTAATPAPGRAGTSPRSAWNPKCWRGSVQQRRADAVGQRSRPAPR